jgi:PTS system fructose-specific IIC component/fructose-specific PTS system IIC-like component
MKAEIKAIQKALMTGVSYMIPFVVAGGILLAVSFLGAKTGTAGVEVTNPIMLNISIIAKSALAMMVPAIAGYTAYSLGGRPAIAPGFVLGYMANQPLNEAGLKAGFVAALIMGLIAGYFVKWMKTWKMPKALISVMPILIIPVIATLVTGLIFQYVISGPVAWLSQQLFGFLESLNGANLIIFAIVLGLICEIDFGGPITKTVTLFTLAMIANGDFVSNGIYRVAPAIPPLAIIFSTFIFKTKWTSQDRENAIPVGIMGVMGITEGAIPFAVDNVKAILPGSMIGCAVGAVIAALTGVESAVPHGGLITAFVVKNPLWYVFAQIVGALVGAVIMGLMKKKIDQKAKPDGI